MADIEYREAGADDAPAMARCRIEDPTGGEADPRMASYFRGESHPQHALRPRTGFVAMAGSRVVGYIAGHLTRRYGCQAEIQWLFVASTHRRSGVGRALVERMARWFLQHEAPHVCVDVDPDSPEARPFYQSLGATVLRPQWMEWRDIGTLAAAPQPRTERDG